MWRNYWTPVAQGGACGESVKASLALQTKTVNRRVVIDCEDKSVCERQAAEVNPSGHGISAVIEFLAGLGIERIKHSRARVQQSLIFSSFLLSILSGRNGKYDPVCNHHRIRQVEIS